MILYRDQFIKKLAEAKILINSWLIFGDEEAEIKNFIKKLTKKIEKNSPEAEKIIFSAAEVKSDPSKLQEVVSSPGLFQSTKIIIISDCGDELSQIIKKILPYIKNDIYLLLYSGPLKKTGSLRVATENNEKIATLHCYKRDVSAFVKEVSAALYANKIKYDEDVPYIIAQNVAVGKTSIDDEIKKIQLYFCSDNTQKHLTTKIASEIITQQNEILLNNLCFYFCTLQKNKLAFEVEKSSFAQQNNMLIVRSLQNFMIRLISVQKATAKSGLEKAMQSLKPPLFGQQKKEFCDALDATSLRKKIILLKYCINIESELKNNGNKLLLSHRLMCV